MNVDVNKLTELVSTEKIKAQAFDAPVPSSVLVRAKMDHSGQDALEVEVVFPEDTPDTVFATGKVNKLLSWIQDTLLTETNDELFPYVVVRREKEPLCHA